MDFLIGGAGILLSAFAVMFISGSTGAIIAAACAIGLIAHLLHGLVDPGFRLNLGIAELLYTGLGLIAGVRAAQRRAAAERYREGYGP